jgi:hypothetical protein
MRLHTTSGKKMQRQLRQLRVPPNNGTDCRVSQRRRARADFRSFCTRFRRDTSWRKGDVSCAAALACKFSEIVGIYRQRGIRFTL